VPACADLCGACAKGVQKRRPVTWQGLRKAVYLNVSEQLPDTVIHYVGLCGSFLAIREYTIYFVYQSAKDFLCDCLLNRHL